MIDEPRNVWKRFWSHFTGFDILDVFIYGGLGLALLGSVIYLVAKSLFDTGNHAGLVAFSGIIVLSVFSLARDLRRKHLSMPSKLLVSAWALCVGIVIVAELFELVG